MTIAPPSLPRPPRAPSPATVTRHELDTPARTVPAFAATGETGPRASRCGCRSSTPTAAPDGGGPRIDVLLDFDASSSGCTPATCSTTSGRRASAARLPAAGGRGRVARRRPAGARRAAGARGARDGVGRGACRRDRRDQPACSAAARARAGWSDGPTAATPGPSSPSATPSRRSWSRSWSAAAESLVAGELARVRRCADPRCARVFLDSTKNGRRRWCDMSTCGNRAKAARHRAKRHTDAG